jgi:hypothetical protein
MMSASGVFLDGNDEGVSGAARVLIIAPKGTVINLG